MKKIVIKGNLKNQESIASIIKEVNRIPCRSNFDFKNGIVTVENVCEDFVDNLIDLFNKYYSTLSIDIHNTNQFQDGTKKLGAKSEDNFIIKKDDFQSEYVQEHINKLLRTISWAFRIGKATEKDIGKYISTCIHEISIRYALNPIVDFSIGDIVDVNYGVHLPGEITGGHVHAIVCDILNNDMAYVVPITKPREEISSRTYMRICAPRDATYNNEFFEGGIVLVDKGKYVRVERFNYIVGKTTPEFLAELFEMLLVAFDFTRNVSSNEKADRVKGTKQSKEAKNSVGKHEREIVNVIGDAFEKLDKNNPLSEQITIFIKDIGMPTSEKLIIQLFEVACNVEKISYESITNELLKKNPNMNKENIKAILREIFNNWLEKYPTLAENCPNISIMSILKVFVKRIKTD